MENRASVTGWQKLFFSYKKMLLVLFHGFCSFVLHHLCLVHAVPYSHLILRVLNFTIWEISKNP